MCVCSNNCNGRSSTGSVQQATGLRVGLFVFLERKWFKNKPKQVLPRKVVLSTAEVGMFQDSPDSFHYVLRQQSLKC